jgi:hypothetical protein
MAWVVAWLSLLRHDWTREKRRRTRDAFLYYDGAHGLLPEAAGTLVYSVVPLVSEGLSQLLFIGLGIVAYVAARKTEDGLASANGYQAGPYQGNVMFGLEEPSPEFPTRRYRVGVSLTTWPVVVGVSVALYVSAFIAASALAWLRAWVRS